MKKRIFSMAMAIIMCMSLLPTAALAAEGGEERPACTCETQCTEERCAEDCPVCAEDPALCAGGETGPVTESEPEPIPVLELESEMATTAGPVTGSADFITALPQSSMLYAIRPYAISLFSLDAPVDTYPSDGNYFGSQLADDEYATLFYEELCDEDNLDAIKSGGPVIVTLIPPVTLPEIPTLSDSPTNDEIGAYNAAVDAYNSALSDLDDIDSTTVSSAITDAVAAFDRDHSDVFWTSGVSYRIGVAVDGVMPSEGCSYESGKTYSYQVEITLPISYSWSTDGRNIDDDISTVTSTVSSIVAAAKEAGTDTYTQLLYVHDWLTKNNVYNSTAANTVGYNQSAPWEAISALDNTLSPVCEGYSRAFKLCCDKLGIPCVLVSGTGTNSQGNSEAHMWTYVQMDDDVWYAVDVTWDDPVVNENSNTTSGHEYWNYFLVGSNAMTDHAPSSNDFLDGGNYEFAYPTLNATAYTPPALALNYSDMPVSLTIDDLVNLTASVTNGTADATYTYAVTEGSLPWDLSIDKDTGAITGTLTAYRAEATPVTITATETDSNRTATCEITFPAVAKKANTVTFGSNALTQFYKDDTGVYYMSGSTRTAISAGAFPTTATGGTVTYTYSSNGTNYSDSLPGTVGTWTVKASTDGNAEYGPAENTFCITVTAKAVSGLTITQAPTKTGYVVGENFSSDGMVVKATYNDGTTEDAFTNYTVEGGTSLTLGTTAVIIKAGTASATQSIDVAEKAVTRIDIITPPNKTSYVDGQNFDPTGMVVKATYNDGTTEDAFTDYTIEGGTSLTLDTTAVTIKAGTASVTQNITVIAKAIQSIAITTVPTKQMYTIGETADWAGMIVTATYNDHSTKELSVSEYSVTGFDSGAADDSQTITVTETVTTAEADRKTATFTIVIHKKALAASDFTVTPPASATYTGGTIVPTVSCTASGAGSVTAFYKQDGASVATPTNAGTYDVYVTVTESDTYTGLSETKVGSFTIRKAAPTITASDKTIVVNATAQNLGAEVTPSGLSLAYASSNTGLVTVDASGNVTGVATGSAAITISTPGSDNYEPASIVITVTVTNKTPVTVTFPNAASQSYTESGYTLGSQFTNAAVDGGKTITGYKYDGTTYSTLESLTVNVTDVGTYTVTAYYSSETEYGEASAAFEITKAEQAALSITSGITVQFGDTLALTTSGGSGTGEVTYAVTNGTGEAAIDSSTGILTPTKVGTVTVQAVKAGDSNYNAGTAVTATITITQAAAQNLNNQNVSVRYNITGEQTYSLPDLMPSDAGTLTYNAGTKTDADSIIANWDVVNGVLTYQLASGLDVTKAGKTATLPVIIGSNNYADSTVNVVITLTDLEAQDTLTITSGTTVTYGDTLTLTTSGGSGTGAVTFTVTDGTGSATVSGDTLTAVKAGTVTVTATKASDGTYAEITSVPVTITIAPKSVNGAVIGLDTGLIYNGSVQTQNVTSVTVDGSILTADDYTVTNNTGTNAGGYTLTVNGTGNYTGTATKQFTIAPKTVSITSAVAADRAYNGSDSVAITSVTFDESALTTADYTAAGKMADANAGVGKTVTVTVTLTNANYTLSTGTTITTVTISKAPAPALFNRAVSVKYSETAAQTVSLAGLMPADAGDTLTYTEGTKADADGIIAGWSVGVDGTLTYTLTSGLDAAAVNKTATLPVTISSANYENAAVSVIITLTNLQNQAPLTITSGATVTYGNTLALTTGGGSGTGAVTFTVTDGTGAATVSGGTLTAVKAGTVTITAAKASDGTYAAVTSAPVTITITPASIEGAEVTLDPAVAAGSAKDDEVRTTTVKSVKLNGVLLTAGTDYTVTVPTGMKKAGSYPVTVTGTGNYTGSVTATFVINPVEEAPVLPPELEETETTKFKVEMETGLSEVPAAFVSNPTLNTPVKIETELKTEITENTSIPEENTAVYEVTLMVSRNGGAWEKATADNFPSDGRLTVTLPYPDGTDSRYTFTVVHMFTTADFNKTPGATETPKVTNTADGIRFTVTGLSPISVGWTEPRSSGTGSSGGSSASAVYSITVEDTAHGTVQANRTRASSGTTVTLTVTADRGYELDDLIVTDSKGNELKLTDKGSGKYTFKMPGRKVTVEAVFVPVEIEDVPVPVETPCDGGASCLSRAFPDLDPTAWYHLAVDFVIGNGLMGGYGTGLFGPNDNLSRAELAQILYNMEGRPAVTGESVFEDVADGAWYTDAILWASANGIVEGNGSDRFCPDNPIAREELAVMLYRYAVYKGMTVVTLEENLSGYSDADTVSGFAIQAMNWAVGRGVIKGDGVGLDPRGSASRAVVAQMLKNFAEI